MFNTDDMGLAALLKSAENQASDLPRDLLQMAYEIEVRHQFEKNRDLPLGELAKLVEHHVDNAVSSK